jgi:hypothetical protein
MKKIYLVSGGSYSDYMIYGVFDNRELAEKYKNLYDSSDYNVEEMELNPKELDINAGKRAYRVAFNKDEIESIDIQSPDYTHGQYSVFTFLYINVWARDEEHAKKSAADLRIRGLANNLFKMNKYGYEKIGNDYTNNVVK